MSYHLVQVASPRQDERVGKGLGGFGRKSSCPGPEPALG